MTDLDRELIMLKADYLDGLGRTTEAARARDLANQADADAAQPQAPSPLSADSSEDEVAQLALVTLESEKRRIEHEIAALQEDERSTRLRLKEELVRAYGGLTPSDENVLLGVRAIVDPEDLSDVEREEHLGTRRGRRARP